MNPSTTQLQYGQSAPLPQPLQLRAGPLTAIFEPHTGFLRYVRLGDHEIIRAIYGAIRDQNWATIPPVFSNVLPEVSKDSFRITFDAHCRNEIVDYAWRGIITGDASGQIAYQFDGEARSAFQRNRIGLCVHHPIVECAGKSCAIEHDSGVVEKVAFPRSISAEQPFFDVRAITHEVATTGVQAQIRFAGDVFETEDQRNWTDASFKTYSTPLALPAPVAVRPGDGVSQSVTLSLQGYSRPVLPVLHGRPPQISVATTPVLTLPALGLCVAGHNEALTSREIERLRVLKLSHLRVDLDLASPNYVSLLQRAAKEAELVNAGLHLALTLSSNAVEELASLPRHLADIKPRVLLWLAFPKGDGVADGNLVSIVQAFLQQHARGALLAAGTKQFFAEINRFRPPPDSPAFPCYSINPQVHQTDVVTLVENLMAQASTAETAREFSPKPVVASPITLKSPFNPEMRLAARGPGVLPADVDARQSSLFGAGWTLGSIARLAATGNVHSLTYYDTTGWRGVMETEAGSPLPDKFPSRAGSVYPVYHLLADIGEFPTRQVYPTHSSHPLSVEALTLSDGKRRRILVASYSTEPLEVKIKTGTCRARIRYLDEKNATAAMENPEEFRVAPGATCDSVAGKVELRLLPFALARVDID